MNFDTNQTVALSRRLNFRRYLSVSIGRIKHYGYRPCATLNLAGRAAPIFLHYCQLREVGIRYFKKWNSGWIGVNAGGVRSAASELGVSAEKMFELCVRWNVGWWEPYALVHRAGIVEQHDSAANLPEVEFVPGGDDIIPASLPCWREDDRDATAWGKIPLEILTEFNEWLSTLHKNQERNEATRTKQIRNLAKVKRVRNLRPDTTQAGGGRV
tara:strand:- start:344 stop:982 length:639 start_codon:yes stop_codon:yes gene_type:complete